MKDTQLFKKQLERLCNIWTWNPTDAQLAEIARQFALKPPNTVSEAHAIVRAVYPGAQYMVMEGIDNSDLRALLALAIAAAKG
ncbi:hypothetical protein [Burkholderia ubonensis]|uniref:hypothetical protein n=1 Tax=Burkholderia ubonensis TaxID=101571 RepID=UPI000755829C|nr:hypothetical protein [Burkholderia ubonensis]KWB76392.1 hypothetical protein WL42_18415 [Burkholderia ubonensis]